MHKDFQEWLAELDQANRCFTFSYERLMYRYWRWFGPRILAKRLMADLK